MDGKLQISGVKTDLCGIVLDRQLITMDWMGATYIMGKSDADTDKVFRKFKNCKEKGTQTPREIGMNIVHCNIANSSAATQSFVRVRIKNKQ